MKNIFTALAIGFSCSFAAAQYKPVDEGSGIRFVIKNIGINTKGSFTGLQGHIRFDRSHPESALFDVSVDAGSVNTSNHTRDGHLKKEEYLDAGHYPKMHFVSGRVISDGAGGFIAYGRLTIKNHTKDISFPFKAKAEADGWLFTGSFHINRKDFGVGGSNTISNGLEVELVVNARK